MLAHSDDLRAEVADIEDAEREAWIAALQQDWRGADLSPVDAGLCAYAEKLTLRPAEIEETDVAALRSVGLDDPAIHHAIQVIAYFNYINRVADAIDVELEPGMPPDPRR
jgi:uncharacterized peroxidase-related enzyme